MPISPARLLRGDLLSPVPLRLERIVLGRNGAVEFVQAPRPELYDLIRDPKETHDVSAQYPGSPQALSAQLDALSPDVAAAPAPAELDPEADGDVCARWVTSAAASRRRSGEPDPGPIRKTRCRCSRSCCGRSRSASAGQLDAAATRSRHRSREGAENPAVHLALSSLHLRRGDAQAAADSARRAVALDPESRSAC